jgi:F420-dependent oxidoreductase-like protein
MEIGLFAGPSTVDALVAESKAAVAEGFASMWVPQIFGIDALMAIAVAARETPGLHFGTSVIPTYPRHPMVLAQQALTAQAVSQGRLTLGIGLSHKIVIEGMYGMSYDKPAIHMREYLSILLSEIQTGNSNFTGTVLTGRGPVTIPDATPMPVMIAAMAPRMLELAATVADGTILWMTGPKTIESYIVPTMTTAAAKADRPAPKTVAGIPMCLTKDTDGMRAHAAKEYAIYGQLPSYRAMLDREGLEGPADLAIIGDEATIRQGVTRMAESGVDIFAAALFGSPEDQAATREVMSDIARASNK